ncbi:MAG: isoprenyl transferase [Chloroflexi bacterium]|nr:isoprenyl transferase [Chloroflexota bacterium]
MAVRSTTAQESRVQLNGHQVSLEAIPRHVAVIMDGNGRWAQRKHLPRLAGHRAGTENIRRVVKALSKYGVKVATLYAFSTENWSRPKEEVRGLMEIMGKVIHRESLEFHKQGVRLQHLGRLERLPQQLREAVMKAIELTQKNEVFTLCVAFDYGGRDEIIGAIQRLIADGVPAEAVTADLLSGYLYTGNIPDPDLIIRTAGEMRLSNFLLWQSAYSEYYSTPTLWPDFNEREVEKALLEYQRRQRRFGGLTPVR